jgi:uncharacterized integral membrane protein (TIGR00697 family)
MVASAISYFISQFVDVYLFHKIRTLTGERLKWLRNNCATCVAQFLDTVIFLLIGFYGKKIGEVMSASGIAEPVLLTGKLWWTFVFSTWAIKFLVALFDTPFFYWATMREAKK